MTKQQFIREHRAEIDAHILRVCPNVGTLNDTDRGQWIDNDEGLYHWMRQECRRGKAWGVNSRMAYRLQSRQA